MIHSESIIKLSAALCKAQKKFKTALKKSKNPYFHSNYADYTEVLSCVKEALNEEGITILQPIDEDVVETVLLHESGEFLCSVTKIYNISNKPQDYGSAITYARRYALSSMLAIDSDEDDDGNRANCNTSNTPTNKAPKEVQKDPLVELRHIASSILTSKYMTTEELEKTLGFPLVEMKAHFEEGKKILIKLKKEFNL